MPKRDAKRVRAELRSANQALRDWRAKAHEYVPGGPAQYLKALRRLEARVERLAQERAASETRSAGLKRPAGSV